MGDGDVTNSKPASFSEVFDSQCSQYLFMGMTYEQYWEQDPWIAKYYREAYEVRRDAENANAWWNGMYTFTAICTALSNIHLDGKHHKINEYPKEPFRIREKSEEEIKKEQDALVQQAIENLNRLKAMWDKKDKGVPNG